MGPFMVTIMVMVKNKIGLSLNDYGLVTDSVTDPVTILSQSSHGAYQATLQLGSKIVQHVAKNVWHELKMCGIVPKTCGKVPEICSMVPKMFCMVPKMCNMVLNMSSMVSERCTMVSGRPTMLSRRSNMVSTAVQLVFNPSSQLVPQLELYSQLQLSLWSDPIEF